MAELDDVIATLYAERYGRPTWWVSAPPAYTVDDDTSCARRRRDLDLAFAEQDPTRTEAAA